MVTFKYEQWLWKSGFFHIGLPAHLSEYVTADWTNIQSWVTTLHDPEGNTKRWSWFQLYIDYRLKYPAGSPWYHLGSKQWRFSQTRPKSTFLKQVRWFNAYISKVGQHLVEKMPINQQNPDSCYICFKTKTLPVRVPEERHLALEQFLGTFKNCFTTPKELLAVMDE